ncbi:hypothetical protein H7J86_24440 [Mycobacterium hackensackense]|uniref:hypothetical protein n=1 Tax=Mycobacterium hackensackense TaxID=228909 RepID=UPI0022659D9B|nr:hypothetical protein [Mycobacterium hackensackense]MCV7255317.1 hypothetical protein [Mycobacterium hackensackense]
MGCCDHEEHDYCCRCPNTFADKVIDIIVDVLTGEYTGDALDRGTPLPNMAPDAAAEAAKVLVAVFEHEDVI